MKVWAALLHVRALAGHSEVLENGAAGAFAVVVSLARDEEHYREMVAAEMHSLGLFIAEVEGVSPYVPDAADMEEVRSCVAKLSPEWPVQYQTFHTYPREEA